MHLTRRYHRSMSSETFQDVLAKLTPEAQALLGQYFRSESARKAGRAGTGDSKRRDPAKMRRAQKLGVAARLAKKKKSENNP